MATTDIQRSLTRAPSKHPALDGIIRPHLRLEPCEKEPDSSWNIQSVGTKDFSLTKRSPTQPGGNKLKFSGTTVLQSTVESDNKRRAILLKRSASKYNPQSTEAPDPNSEIKSATIRRMQDSLENWNEQLKEIVNKKERDDLALQFEIDKRDTEIEEMERKYSGEKKLRIKAEKKGNTLSDQLENVEKALDELKEQLEQCHSQLVEYELAYEQLDSKKVHLEEELQTSTEQLQQSEMMRRRLNDHVTELQGQLAIEEQRSKFCTIQ